MLRMMSLHYRMLSPSRLHRVINMMLLSHVNARFTCLSDQDPGRGHATACPTFGCSSFSSRNAPSSTTHSANKTPLYIPPFLYTVIHPSWNHPQHPLATPSLRRPAAQNSALDLLTPSTIETLKHWPNTNNSQARQDAADRSPPRRHSSTTTGARPTISRPGPGTGAEW